MVCGFLLGAAGQVVKLCADSAMQLDVDDPLRGHVFAVQDSLFWVSFIVAITRGGRGDSRRRARTAVGGRRIGDLSARSRRPRDQSVRRAPSPRDYGSPTWPQPGTVIDDLAAESDELDAAGRAAGGRRAGPTATPAPGWSIAHQIAHLLWTDRVALVVGHRRGGASATCWPPPQPIPPDSSTQAPRSWRSPRPLTCWPIGGSPGDGCTTRCAAVPDGRKLLWFGPPMSAASMATARLMETWAHGLDVADALGVIARPPPGCGRSHTSGCAPATTHSSFTG